MEIKITENRKYRQKRQLSSPAADAQRHSLKYNKISSNLHAEFLLKLKFIKQNCLELLWTENTFCRFKKFKIQTTIYKKHQHLTPIRPRVKTLIEKRVKAYLPLAGNMAKLVTAKRVGNIFKSKYSFPSLRRTAWGGRVSELAD